MRKGTFTGVMERFAVAETLARKIYATQGCEVPSDAPRNYMHRSQHPQEQACVAAALIAIEMLMSDR